MSHASMLKARRQHQKTRKLLDGAAKQAKRLAKQALAGPAVKKERVKKEKVKKEKVQTEKVKKVKLTKEELGRQDAKKSTAGAGKKARPSLSRPGIGAAYCVESRRPACVKRRTRVAAYAYHLMRLVASGSSASVTSWPLAPVSPRCHKAADAPAAGIPSVTFRHRSQTGASGQNLT